MCGIAGLSAPASSDAEALAIALQRMSNAIRHRGPDDQGDQWFHDAAQHVGLAHRRLAILDLSPAGHQPMHDPATGNWIIFNGEIYNHLEIRTELGAPVDAWRSSSDTETILRAYAKWGVDCLSRMRGMFAFALYDANAKRLWCTRDRLGIKPFYYSTRGGVFSFASEVRALQASQLISKSISQAGLAGYIRFGTAPDPHTLLEDVQSLPAGHWLNVEAGKIAEQQCYWKPWPVEHAPKGEARDVIREQLQRAVREHLLSDVPVAVFLSGGIDSSVVTALAAKSVSTPIQTFTVGFDEKKFDEAPYAEAVAKKFQTQHRTVRLSSDEIAKRVPQAIAAQDVPSVDAVNTYIVSGAVAEAGFKVVLSGLGGDELFGGYPSFFLLPKAQRWSPVLGQIPASLRAWAARGGQRGERAAELTAQGLTLAERYAVVRGLWPKAFLAGAGLNAPIWSDDTESADSLPRRISMLELTGYMRDMLLRDSDVMSMAHGLELRVPFLDHTFVENCIALDAASHASAKRPKALLLEALGDVLPEGIGDRPKQGFTLPMDNWMRGPLREYARQGVDAFRLACPDVSSALDVNAIEEGFVQQKTHWARIWQFVVLGHWLNRA